jgi:hypothetical protein
LQNSGILNSITVSIIKASAASTLLCDINL